MAGRWTRRTAGEVVKEMEGSGNGGVVVEEGAAKTGDWKKGGVAEGKKSGAAGSGYKPGDGDKKEVKKDSIITRLLAEALAEAAEKQRNQRNQQRSSGISGSSSSSINSSY